MHRQHHAVAVAFGLETGMGHFTLGLMGGGLGDRQHWRRRGFAHFLDGFVQRAFGQRVGDEVVGAQTQQLMQGDRADLIGDQHHLQAMGLGLFDDLADARQVGFIGGIDRDGDKLQTASVWLIQEHGGIVERQVAPAFAQFQFHIVDQQVKILHVARNGAREDRCRFRLKVCYAAHRPKSFQLSQKGTGILCLFSGFG